MGIVLKRSIFLNRNAPVRLRLKSPETLSAYSSGRCGSALKLPWSEHNVVNNLWQLLFYKLTNCSNSTSVQHYKLLNLRYFSGILKQLSKLNSAFNHFLFFFCFSHEIYYLNRREGIVVLFYNRNNNDNDKKDTKMRKQRKPRHWKVSLNQPRFHVLEGLQMALSHNFLQK